ncbi:hypothetical protein LCGC14_0791890 [marine sediment metagenome]|uniref:Uncharacterized protein n=1 Tax=marine sediment metagenome TaxID=412755 RepID=A0A0F9PWJ6_9ZZZZ|nr:hypothetical protein [archaeon]
MKQTAEETFDEIMNHLENIEKKLEKKVHEKEESKKKNSHLHMFLETSLMDRLREEASDKNMSISELVRQKLRDDNQLDRIERKIDKL